MCWDTAYFSPTALLWNHSKSPETVAILDDTSLRVLLSQISQQDTEMTRGSSFMKWQVRVEKLNHNYSHNLFSCFSSLKKTLKHIKYIKKQQIPPSYIFFLTNWNNTGFIGRSLLFTATLFFFRSFIVLRHVFLSGTKISFFHFVATYEVCFLCRKKCVLLFSLILLHTCLGKPKMYLCVWVSCSSCTVHELACHTNAIVVRNAWCRGVETNCFGLFQKAA